ncbi:MAG: hypothetical protein M1480_02125 [Bacteroidetes bacterium]|nr:hypothetical protein [Bacteroidota bacterium]
MIIDGKTIRHDCNQTHIYRDQMHGDRRKMSPRDSKMHDGCSFMRVVNSKKLKID